MDATRPVDSGAERSDASTERILVVTATRLETRAARSALGSRAVVVRVGVGGKLSSVGNATALISVGLCGALDAGLAPGEAVIPDEVGSATEPRVSCAPWLVDALRTAAADRGAQVHRGPLLTVDRMVTGRERAALAAAGWAAVDMETALVAGTGMPTAAVRVVLDTPASELDPAWERPSTALLRPRLWGQARRLARQAPRYARLAADIVAGALDLIPVGAASA